METKWTETGQGIPGAGMRGAGGPSTGAGMATGAPGPVPTGHEQEARKHLSQVKRQLRNAPGGEGDVAGRNDSPRYGKT